MKKIVVVLAAMLAAAAMFRAWYDFDHYYGVDYYQFWGVPVAHEQLGGNPYSQIPQYAAALNRMADVSQDAHLHWANHYRREIQPAATPFFYAVSALLPHAYDTGYAAWIATMFVALAGSVYWMARRQGAGRAMSLAIAAGIALSFAPFDDGVKAGNVNAHQLAFLVMAIAFAGRPTEEPRGFLGSLYFALLALFVMWKPNTALIVVFLAMQFFLTRDLRTSMLSAGGAVAATIAAVVVGAGYFDGMRAWSDWSAYVNGHEGLLVYRTEEGNISIAMLMSQRSGGMGAVAYGAMLGAAMLVVVAASLTAFGRHVGGLAARAGKLLEDPWFAASVGVLVTLIASPLVWPHYIVLALIPAGWAWGAHRGWDMPRSLVVLGYALLVMPMFLSAAGSAKVSLFMLGWLPFAAAVVMRLVPLDKPAAV